MPLETATRVLPLKRRALLQHRCVYAGSGNEEQAGSSSLQYCGQYVIDETRSVTARRSINAQRRCTAATGAQSTMLASCSRQCLRYVQQRYEVPT